MPRTEFSGLPWPQLAARLERGGALVRWAEQEPLLAEFDTAERLRTALRSRRDPLAHDALLGALVRLAAVDGGGDEDAVFALMYALAYPARGIALSLRDLSPDIDELVMGQLWLQARTFPWRRRTHAYAKNLLLDTRLALVKELLPYRPRGNVRSVALSPFDPDTEWDATYASTTAHWDRHDRDEPDLADVLQWAQHSGVLTAGDIGLLIDLIEAATEADDGTARCGGDVNTAAELAVLAARYERAPRTLRKRRDYALRLLRQSSQDYLHTVA